MYHLELTGGSLEKPLCLFVTGSECRTQDLGGDNFVSEWVKKVWEIRNVNSLGRQPL